MKVESEFSPKPKNPICITDENLTDTPEVMALIEARQIHAYKCRERDQLAEHIGRAAATLAVFYPIMIVTDDPVTFEDSDGKQD